MPAYADLIQLNQPFTPAQGAPVHWSCPSSKAAPSPAALRRAAVKPGPLHPSSGAFGPILIRE